jgi:hypothetical protein
MKTFSYKCRDKNWAVKTGSICANDRSEALRELKRQGFVPMSLTEGSATKHAHFLFTISPRILSISFGLLVTVTGFVVFLLWPRHPREKGANARIESSVTHLPPVVTSSKVPASSVVEKMTVISPEPGVSVQDSLPVVKKTAVPSSPVILPQRQTPVMVQASPAEDTPKEIEILALKTPSEQLIGMLGRPGEEVPPLPELPDETLEEDFEKAATNLIVISDRDDAATIAHKENVAWIKEYIKEAKKMGWTPAEYIRELEKQRKEEVLNRNTAQEILEQIENEFPNQAEAAREELNKELEKKGILPLDQE